MSGRTVYQFTPKIGFSGLWLAILFRGLEKLLCGAASTDESIYKLMSVLNSVRETQFQTVCHIPRICHSLSH